MHIGNDRQPVTIVKLASINSQTWKKSACFESFKNTVYSLVEDHSTVEVTSFISTELPLDTGASFQVDQTATKAIMDCMFNVGFLELIVFLNSQGKTFQIGDPDDLLKRPEDITYFKLRCVLDGESQDHGVTTAETPNFQFYLLLP